MNTIDVYRATVTVAGRAIFAWESFWPIPTRTDDLAPGRVRRVIGGNYPIVVNLPEGEKLVSEARPFHRLTPTEKGVVSEEIGERRTVAFGGLSLGAADVYRRAMAGLDGFAVALGIERPRPPGPVPTALEYPVYSAPREVRDPTTGKLVDRVLEWSWYPIAPAGWIDPRTGFRHVQADGLFPSYFVSAPATAELVDRLGQGVRTLRLSPDDPPPWLDPDDLVRLALAGERGLRARRVAPDLQPVAAVAATPPPADPEPEPASPPPAPAPTIQPRRVARRSKASAGQLSFNW